MKKIFTVLLLALFVSVAFAQERPTGIFRKASVAPQIDGVLDEVWAESEVYNIDRNFQSELPTLGLAGETTWRALWNDDGVFVFLEVADDDWYPTYMESGSNHWEYDKVEVYFDVNYVLEDGAGAGPANNGHHQVAPKPNEAKIDGTPHTGPYDGDGTHAEVVWAYKVNAPNYTFECFVPFSVLVDENGIMVDKTGTIGFDVTVIDRDQGDETRKRAVWANSVVDESWNNMDGVGHVTFDGAGAPTYIDNITLVGGEITTDNGTLQIEAVIEPENASNKKLRWSVENKTGRARIDQNGLLTAVLDGVVTVIADATDGSYEQAMVDVTISGQIPTEWELNVVRNGLFDQLDDGGNPLHWGGWIDGGYGDPWQVIDGIAVLYPTQAHETDNWHYQFNQTGLDALPDIPYVVSYKAWSDVNRNITMDFEDTSGNNYNRYGASPDPESNGRSEWTHAVSPEATMFVFNVTFDQMVETTVQKIQYMISQAVGTVYLDSVLLISQADLDMIDEITHVPQTVMETIKVYPNPAVYDVSVVLPTSNELVAIYNTLGVKMDEVRVAGNMHRFDVSTYPKGLYFVRSNNSVVKFLKIE